MDTDTSSRAIVISVPSRLVLIGRDGPCKGQMFDTSTLNCSYLTVGRKKKSIAWIKDKAVSEDHAEIKWDFKLGSWTLKDTNSSNGTKLNGIALEPQHAHQLTKGDRILFGMDSIVEVEVEEQTLKDVNVETLIRAYVESVCQELEADAAKTASDTTRCAQTALDALLKSPEANKVAAGAS
ncbi:hypothetical protein VaNZ11_010175 [Volvox africanus]|uniref:FHA domain-containing protein n=1 Tax=Volvox africanus TaxID=51714 RepID=A0ABQ5S9R1_9CHLO|nr:hypothetical protein VaNZ11_010175 [Volvox africanus]